MPTQLQIEDLILSSRSLALEEKQELLKRLDTLATEQQTELRAILEEEFTSFQRLGKLELQAIEQFAMSLKPLTQLLTTPH